MTVKYLTKPIFWKNNIDFPSLEVFNSDYENQFLSSDELKVNFIDFYTITLNTTLDISYIKINNKYYLFDSVLRISSNNVKTLQFRLDLYTTYFLSLLKNETFINTKFHSVRNPILTQDTLLYEDPLKSTLKYNGDYNFEKYNFVYFNSSTTGTGPGGWEFKTRKLIYPGTGVPFEHDAVNGVMYAIFNAGTEGKYLFIPILSKSTNVTTENVRGPLENIYVLTPNRDGSPTPGKMLRDYEVITKNGQPSTFGEFYADYWNALNHNYNKYFNFYTSNGRYESINYMPGQAIYDTRVNYYQENNYYKVRFINNAYELISGALYSLESVAANQQFTFHIAQEPSSSGSIPQTLVSNSYATINEIKNSIEYSNKFLGLYFLPHIFILGKYWDYLDISYTYNQISKTVRLLVLDLNPEGNTVLEFPFINNRLLTNQVTYNQDVITNLYLYKYLPAKYFNNDIDLSLFYNQNENTFTSDGYFNFTGVANFVDKIYGFSITNCLWSFPYQLPSGTNSYLQYVAANYNTTNTSLDIAKQQFNLNKKSIAMNSAFSGLQNILGGIGNALSGNWTGLASNVLGLGQTIGGGSIQGLQNKLTYQSQIDLTNSKYADAKNTYGSTIHNSAVNDAAWINYYLKDNEQYYGIELFNGSSSFNKQLNNMIFFNGYYSPNLLSINEMLADTSNEWICFFNLEDSDIDNKAYLINSLLYNIEPLLNEDIINYINTLLSKGVRIWKKNPEGFNW